VTKILQLNLECGKLSLHIECFDSTKLVDTYLRAFF
jgi:hypothetical protein